MADQHTLLAGETLLAAERAAVDHVVDADGNVVDRDKHDLADFTDAPLFFATQNVAGGRRLAFGKSLVHGITAPADQAQPTDDLNRLARRYVLAPDIAVGGRNGVLQLLERNTVAF